MLFGNANPQVESTISRGIPKFGGWLVHSLSLSFGLPHRSCAEDMAWLVSLWLQANNKTKHLGVLIGWIWAKESGGWRWWDLWHRGLRFQTMGYVVSSVLGGMLSHQTTGIIIGFHIAEQSRHAVGSSDVNREVLIENYHGQSDIAAGNPAWANESSMAIAVVACQHVCALGETPNPMSHTGPCRWEIRDAALLKGAVWGGSAPKNSVSHLGNVHTSHI